MSNPTLWLVVALALGGLEIFTGTFMLLFFAVAAFAVSIIAYAGFQDWIWQVAFFAIISVLGLVSLRKRLVDAFQKGGGEYTGDVGNIVILKEDVAPGASTTVDYQGALWSAENIGPEMLKKGLGAKIAEHKSNRLLIKS